MYLNALLRMPEIIHLTNIRGDPSEATQLGEGEGLTVKEGEGKLGQGGEWWREEEVCVCLTRR